MELKTDIQLSTDALARREQLLYIVQDGKLRESDKKVIGELLREPEMMDKIRAVSEMLFGKSRFSGQAVNLAPKGTEIKKGDNLND